ncbi:uncharacterized protein K452DRAFT_285317, partial [Aplosporella prunicola CBS 121167]
MAHCEVDASYLLYFDRQFLLCIVCVFESVCSMLYCQRQKGKIHSHPSVPSLQLLGILHSGFTIPSQSNDRKPGR